MDFWRNKVVVVSVVVAAVAAGIAMTVMSWTHDPDSQVAPPPEEAISYYCTKCKKEFRLTAEEFSRQTPDPAIAEKDPAMARNPHCPQCGAKHSGVMMVQCPNCKKFYLPPGAGKIGPVPEGTADRCPHCKTDRNEWYRTHSAGR